jgi:hypothetical protein
MVVIQQKIEVDHVGAESKMSIVCVLQIWQLIWSLRRRRHSRRRHRAGKTTKARFQL